MKTPFKRHLGAALLVIAAVLGAGSAPALAANNAIQNVSASRQGTETVVQIQLAQPLAATPNGFVIDQPARIVLDNEKIQGWLAKGAQPTDRVLRFLDQAGLAKRPARNNPQKAEPGEKARERAAKRAEKAAAPAEDAAA